MKVTPIMPVSKPAMNVRRPICYGLHVNRATVFYQDGSRQEYPAGLDGMRLAWETFEAGRKGILV